MKKVISTLFLAFVTTVLLVWLGPAWNSRRNTLCSTSRLAPLSRKRMSFQSFFSLDHPGDPSIIFPCDDDQDTPLPSWIVHHAGPISPFHRTSSYEPPPKGCKVVQVHQLQRHGARYPTHKVTKKIQTALLKLKSSSHLDTSLNFIKNYHYRLGESSLIPLGAAESFRAGSQFALRYKDLIDPKSLPFLRASLSQRVVDSANNFSLGLLSQLGYSHIDPIKALLISENSHSNNTLDNNWCPNRRSSWEKRRWLEIFARPITERLNKLAINANLDERNSLYLMQLCVFQSLSLEKLSQFCSLFHKNDWPGFGYYFDLDKYYGHGVGNNIGGIEGLGYVSELISRLTGDRKWANQDQSKVNHTLDQSDITFPLDRKCYVDFSHDNQMVSILAALGIQTKEELPETGPRFYSSSQSQRWNVSQWMPFGSRLTIEKLTCNNIHPNDQFLRFFLNDMLMELPTRILQQPRKSNKNFNGLYSLFEFIKYQQISLKNSSNLFQKCFIDRKE